MSLKLAVFQHEFISSHVTVKVSNWHRGFAIGLTPPVGISRVLKVG